VNIELVNWRKEKISGAKIKKDFKPDGVVMAWIMKYSDGHQTMFWIFWRRDGGSHRRDH
jgi:hypothetical protein